MHKKLQILVWGSLGDFFSPTDRFKYSVSIVAIGNTMAYITGYLSQIGCSFS